MLAKMTTKNQLTLPKRALEAVGEPRYFEVEVRDGQAFCRRYLQG